MQSSHHHSKQYARRGFQGASGRASFSAAMAAKFNFSFALFDPTFSDCTLRLQLTGTPPRRPVEKAEPSCDEVPGASQDALRACAAGQEDLEPCQGDGRGHSRHGDQDCPPVDAAACVQERSQARSSVTDVQAHRASREGRSREGSEVPVAGSELTEHRGTGQPAPEDPSLAPVLQPSGIESPEIWKENCERWDSGTDQEATARVPPRTPPTGEFSQAGAESHKEEDFVIVQDVEAGSSSSVGELPIDEPGVTEGGSQEDAAGNGTQESAWQSPNGRLDAPASAEAPAQQMCEELGKPNETGSTRDIPVSSVILAAKSTFFRELFATAAAQPVVLLEMPYSGAADTFLAEERLPRCNCSSSIPLPQQLCRSAVALVHAHEGTRVPSATVSRLLFSLLLQTSPSSWSCSPSVTRGRCRVLCACRTRTS